MSKIDPSEYDLDDEEAEKVLKQKQKQSEKSKSKSSSSSGRDILPWLGGSLVVLTFVLSLILGVPPIEVWDALTGMG